MSVEARGQRVKINGVLTDVTYQDTVAREQLDSVKRMIYPVGSIYVSVTNTSPASLFGGTWEQLKDRFLLAAGDSYAAGSTGGEATHTLTTDEMPSHRHSSDSYLDGYANSGLAGTDRFCTWVNYGIHDNNEPKFGESGAVRTSWVGGSQPHNNMPPYRSVYMWQRIA